MRSRAPRPSTSTAPAIRPSAPTCDRQGRHPRWPPFRRCATRCWTSSRTSWPIPPGGSPGAVMDGRDIGTVICPTASRQALCGRAPWTSEPAAAGRNSRPWASAGPSRTWWPNWSARDAADKSRPISPLKQAPDADLLDTSDLGIDAAFAAALALVSPKVDERAQGPPQGLRRPGGLKGIPLTYPKPHRPGASSIVARAAREVRHGSIAAGRHD